MESFSLRRRCAKLLSELLYYPPFRDEIRKTGTEIYSFLCSQDADVRKHVSAGLKLIAVDQASRMDLVQALTPILESLPAQNAVIFWSTVQFLADITCYDEIQNMIAKSDLVNWIITKTNASDVSEITVTVKIIKELMQHDSICVATSVEKVIDFCLTLQCGGVSHGMNDTFYGVDVMTLAPLHIQLAFSQLPPEEEQPTEIVARITLETVVDLLHHKSFRDVIITPDRLEKIIFLLVHAKSDIRKAAMDAVLALVNNNTAISTEGNSEAILKMLSNPVSHIRRAALKMIEVLVQHNVAGPITMPENVAIIISVLTADNTPNFKVQESAAEVIIALANSVSDISTETVENIIDMLRIEDGSWSAILQRRGGLRGIVALAARDATRAMISAVPETIGRIVELLADRDDDVKACAVKAIEALVKHENSWAVVASSRNIQTVLNMLKTQVPHTRKSGLDALVALADQKHLPEAMALPEFTNKMISMLADQDDDVQYSAALAVTRLIFHESAREIICSPENIGRIRRLLSRNVPVRKEVDNVMAYATIEAVSPIMLLPDEVDDIVGDLGDEDRFVRAVHALDILTRNDAFTAVIFNPEHVAKIISMLDSDIRLVVLQAALSIAAFEHVSRKFFTPPILEKIIGMLDDPLPVGKCFAAVSVLCIADHDCFRAKILTPRTIQKIIDVLHQEADAEFEESFDGLVHTLADERFKSLVSTPEHLVYSLSTIDGQIGDARIVSFVEAIIRLGHDVPAITAALTNAALDRISRMAPSAKKAYCEILRLLSLATAKITLENAGKLMTLLRDPDSDIANFAMEIFVCFCVNTTFRTHSLNTIFYKMTAKFLQYPSTARQAVTMMADLAKYDDSKRRMIQSSDIVLELLNLLKRGTTDIDRWEIGLKGLVVLGIFG
ncbi:armadillo-type protein [Mycena rebaudengoi]|nr:armadillo-type protein [Mycena rebaudengoi]